MTHLLVHGPTHKAFNTVKYLSVLKFVSLFSFVPLVLFKEPLKSIIIGRLGLSASLSMQLQAIKSVRHAKTTYKKINGKDDPWINSCNSNTELSSGARQHRWLFTRSLLEEQKTCVAFCEFKIDCLKRNMKQSACNGQQLQIVRCSFGYRSKVGRI